MPHEPIYRKSIAAGASAKRQSKQLRAETTPPEKRLWNHLRKSQLGGHRFRRQHPIGPYIADFYCHDAALVIEVDGSTHRSDRRARDAQRDSWMVSRGLMVLRVTTDELWNNLDGVLRTIRKIANERANASARTPSDPRFAGPPPPLETGEEKPVP
jgi:very-short-patch-repair endonuclease